LSLTESRTPTPVLRARTDAGPAGVIATNEGVDPAKHGDRGAPSYAVLVICGHEERPDRCSRRRSPRNASCCPPTRSCRRRRPPDVPLAGGPPAVTRGGPGRIGSPMRRANGSSAHDAKDARRRSPARSPHCPPNGDPMRPGTPVRSPFRPPRPVDRRRFPPACISSSSGAGCPPLETVAVHLVVPRPSSARPDEPRSEPWEALAGLVVHGTARAAGHPRGAPPQPESAAGRLRAR
jgi:hypothetical protein